MNQLEMYCEPFALRDKELVEVYSEPLGLSDDRCWFSIQARSVTTPAGLKDPHAWPYAIVACRISQHNEWSWLPLAVYTKEALGDLLLTVPDFESDRWYYCVVVPCTDHDEQGLYEEEEPVNESEESTSVDS